MPDHRSHGRPYVQPERHDELSDGIPAASSAAPKRTTQRFEPGSDATREAGRKGGAKSKGTTQLSHRIEPGTLAPESVRRARFLRRSLTTEIATTVGGGYCGVAASLLVKFAAQKTAAAEEAFARGDFEAHRKLSESARMDLLYAREHAAKEAAARPKTRDGKPAWFLAIEAASSTTKGGA